MGFTDKLPLLNSKSRIVKLVGYVLYAFVILIVIGAMFGGDNESSVQSTTHAASDASKEESKPTSVEESKPTSVEESKPTSIPLGDTTVVDDWAVMISSFNPSATRIIMNENMFNDEPSVGGQYAMVYVNAKNLGDKKRSFPTSNLHLEGASGLVYDTEFFPPIAPNAFEKEVFPGAVTRGNIVFDVATQDANSVKLYYDSWGSDKTYFDLR